MSARLYLITPSLTDAAAFAPLLAAAMAVDVACVLLRVASPDEGAIKAAVRTLGPLVQDRGAALLVAGPARVAARIDADGLHVAGVGPELEEALEACRGRRIVGVGLGGGAAASRDEAMRAGESGADYLLFGWPRDGAEDRGDEDQDDEDQDDEDQDAILERVAWWAEIFNVPCVGYARDPSAAGAVARAGAEFVALCDGLWDRPERIAETLQRVQADLHAAAAEATS